MHDCTALVTSCTSCLFKALELVKSASKTGCDAVKFQTYITEELVTMDAGKAEYQKSYESDFIDQYSMLKKFEFSYHQFEELSKFCSKVGIEFLSTAFDVESLKFLKSLGIPLLKAQVRLDLKLRQLLFCC